MISPNHNYDSGGIRVTDVANMHKTLAKATIESVEPISLHCRVIKSGKVEGGVPGFEIGHAVYGYAAAGPIVGNAFYMVRYNTAGREAYGVFETSRVENVTKTANGFDFQTQNSYYRLEFIPDPLT